mgnify:CR=1 FL=1
MKIRLQLILMLSLILFSGQILAQATFRGKVIDDQNLSLPGANIVLEGTNKGTVTNQLGDFVIQGLPPGKYNVVVSYLGYTSLKQEITLQDGQTLEMRFQMMPGTLEGGEVIVFGDRLKGQARALNQQKTNSNITNIVAADIRRIEARHAHVSLMERAGLAAAQLARTLAGDSGTSRNTAASTSSSSSTCARCGTAAPPSPTFMAG